MDHIIPKTTSENSLHKSEKLSFLMVTIFFSISGHISHRLRIFTTLTFHFVAIMIVTCFHPSLFLLALEVTLNLRNCKNRRNIHLSIAGQLVKYMAKGSKLRTACSWTSKPITSGKLTQAKVVRRTVNNETNDAYLCR